MTKNGLTSEDKAVLLGMGVAMSIDFCELFPCPPRGVRSVSLESIN